MAKKRTRKSRRSRAKARQPQPQRAATQPQAPTAPAATARPAPTSVRQSATDFVREYAYVYFDLRKMFALAAVVFILLIVTNVILRYFVVL